MSQSAPGKFFNHFFLNPTTKRSNQLYNQLRNIRKSEIRNFSTLIGWWIIMINIICSRICKMTLIPIRSDTFLVLFPVRYKSHLRKPLCQNENYHVIILNQSALRKILLLHICGKLIQATYQIWMTFPEVGLSHYQESWNYAKIFGWVYQNLPISFFFVLVLPSVAKWTFSIPSWRSLAGFHLVVSRGVF